MASRTRSSSRGLGAAAGPTSRTASANAHASSNAIAYESDPVVRGTSMPTPSASRSTIAGARSWGNRDPVYGIPYGPSAVLLQVAELGPEIGIAEHVRLLPAQHAKHLGGNLHRGAPGRLLGDAGDVRAHDDVVELEQAAVRG